MGFVVAIIGGGLLAAYLLPTISTDHEKSHVSMASATAHQAIASKPPHPISTDKPDEDLSDEREVSAPTVVRATKSLAAVREATAKRNAQTLASVFAAGEAAGVEWSASDVDSAVSRLVEGVAPKSGPFAGRLFCVPSRTINDMDQAKNYLRWDKAESVLKYDPTDADLTR